MNSVRSRLDELKAIAVFGLVLLVWATDKIHGVNATVVAMTGAVIMLAPQFKLLEIGTTLISLGI